MGKLQKFEITLDNPTGVYYAGQTVTGRVEVQLSEPMNMRRIHLTFLGRAKVHWSTGSSKNRTHYRSQEVYFNDRVNLVGSENGETSLPSGLHCFPFNVLLRQNLPSSFEGSNGSVRYTVEAVIDKPWKFDHEARLAFTVICILDLNMEPFTLRGPSLSEVTQDVSCCCCNSGVVSVKMSLNKRLFVPGETILIGAEIHNDSTSSIDRICVSLKQRIEFRAVNDSFFSSGNVKSKSCDNEIAKVIKEEIIPANTTRTVTNLTLLIPPTAPSRLVGCSIINVDYVIKLRVSDAKIPVDIVIGTIPLREASAVVTAQPIAPPVAESQIDITEYDMLPPSYEECVQGRVNIREDGDSEYIRGDMTWAPKYPTYRQLSHTS